MPGGPTFHYRQHGGPRGSSEDRFATDLRNLKWLEYNQRFFRRLHRELPLQEYLPPGMKIIAATGKIFTMSWMLMGFENLCVNLKLNPEFAGKVIEKVAQIQMDGLRQVASIPNMAAIWAVDDIAFSSGPILNPDMLRRYIFPYYEEFGRICREHGLFFFFHTDGVVWDLIEDLIAVGVDALHPPPRGCGLPPARSS